ncbi:hypothetical protein ABMA27_002232 [Loxostege sticticalis]
MASKPDTELIYNKCYKNKTSSSDIYTCIATIKGILTPDGKLDVAKVNKYIEDEFQTDPELVTVIKEACVEGDVSKYGPPEINEITKFFICASYEQVMACPDWTDDVPCDGGKFQMKRIE